MARLRYWSVGVVVKDIGIGVEGRRFDSWAGQIKHSVASGSPPQRRFCGAMLQGAKMGPAARYTVRRNEDMI